jgi:hypothetical protein
VTVATVADEEAALTSTASSPLADTPSVRVTLDVLTP